MRRDPKCEDQWKQKEPIKSRNLQADSDFSKWWVGNFTLKGLKRSKTIKWKS